MCRYRIFLTKKVFVVFSWPKKFLLLSWKWNKPKKNDFGYFGYWKQIVLKTNWSSKCTHRKRNFESWLFICMIQARKAHIHSWAKWFPEGMKWKIRKYEINMNKQTAYIKGRFICTNARKENKDTSSIYSLMVKQYVKIYTKILLDTFLSRWKIQVYK